MYEKWYHSGITEQITIPENPDFMRFPGILSIIPALFLTECYLLEHVHIITFLSDIFCLILIIILSCFHYWYHHGITMSLLILIENGITGYIPTDQPADNQAQHISYRAS